MFKKVPFQSNNVPTSESLQLELTSFLENYEQYIENVNPVTNVTKQDVPTEVAEKIASFTDYKIINSKKQILFKINLNECLSTNIFHGGLTSTDLYLKVIVLDEDVQNSNLDLDLDENMRVKVKQHQNSLDCPCHGWFMVS